MAPVARHPFDDDVEQVLRDPSVIARLDALAVHRHRGDLVLHDDEEVRERLRRLGVPLTGSKSQLRRLGLHAVA